MRNLIPLLFVVAACHSDKMAPSATVPELLAAAMKPKPNWKPPVLRLGDAARPTRYAARLKIILQLAAHPARSGGDGLLAPGMS